MVPPQPPKSTDDMVLYRTARLEGRSGSCGQLGCKCCRAMSKKTLMFSSHNHSAFCLPKHTNCKSKNVIYLLECSLCPNRNQHVGQTARAVQERQAGHRAKAIKDKPTLPIYKHFKREGHNFERDAKMSVLEKCLTSDLTGRESHWINTLETVYPKGLNSRFEIH